MRYDAEHKARTRERVLQEAVRAIRAEGPVEIGVAAIMARAGLTHGGFYAHFGSKDELVLAAIVEMFEGAQGTFERLTEGLDPAEALRTYVRFYLSRSHRDARESGCPLPVLASELPRMAEPARARFQEGLARLTRSLEGVLAALGRPAPSALASSLIAEMIGALAMARAVSDPEQSDLILSRSRAAVLERAGGSQASS